MVTRDCATCGKSLPRASFSTNQWRKRGSGVSRCRGCVGTDAGDTVRAAAAGDARNEHAPTPRAKRGRGAVSVSVSVSVGAGVEPGEITLVEAPVTPRHPRSPPPRTADVHVGDDVTDVSEYMRMQFADLPGSEGVSRDSKRCVHCGTVVALKRGRKSHVTACKSLPADVRGVLDRVAVRACRAGEGRYGGKNRAVYRRFKVTGEGVASCRGCGKVVRGGISALTRHLERMCIAARRINEVRQPRGGPEPPRPWAVVDVEAQFTTPRHCSEQPQCTHCHKVMVGPQIDRWRNRQHLARCKSLPADVRKALDNQAVCESRAEAGRYGGDNRAVYRRFDVTGENVASCKTCGGVVRGGLSSLKEHSDNTCGSAGARGAEVKQQQVDVAAHFTGSGGRQKCSHCHMVTGGQPRDRWRSLAHMAQCKLLPPSVREALDRTAVSESRAEWGRYGGNNRVVFRRFNVTGEHVASCKACGGVVQGGVSLLKRHLERSGCGDIQLGLDSSAPVRVDEHFAVVPDSGGRWRCVHCHVVVARRTRKAHMARCKSLPADVCEVLHRATAARALGRAPPDDGERKSTAIVGVVGCDPVGGSDGGDGGGAVAAVAPSSVVPVVSARSGTPDSVGSQGGGNASSASHAGRHQAKRRRLLVPEALATARHGATEPRLSAVANMVLPTGRAAKGGTCSGGRAAVGMPGLVAAADSDAWSWRGVAGAGVAVAVTSSAAGESGDPGCGGGGGGRGRGHGRVEGGDTQHGGGAGGVNGANIDKSSSSGSGSGSGAGVGDATRGQGRDQGGVATPQPSTPLLPLRGHTQADAPLPVWVAAPLALQPNDREWSRRQARGSEASRTLNHRDALAALPRPQQLHRRREVSHTGSGSHAGLPRAPSRAAADPGSVSFAASAAPASAIATAGGPWSAAPPQPAATARAAVLSARWYPQPVSAPAPVCPCCVCASRSSKQPSSW